MSAAVHYCHAFLPNLHTAGESRSGGGKLMWQSGDPEHRRVDAGWLERLIVRHPIRTPIIAFIITAVFFAVTYFTGMFLLMRFGVFLLIISLGLLIYGLIRKAMDIPLRRKPARTQLPEEPMETNKVTRRESIARWRERARREAEERKIDR